MPETVAAVVVTYNRKELLSECLSGLVHQTRFPNRIFIVDNASTDGTPEMLAERGFLADPLCEYLRMSTNLGGAGGFREGIRRALESGFDWIWIMDDDSEPTSDCLSLLLQTASREKAGGYCPAIYGRDGKLQSYHHKRFNHLGRERIAWDGKSTQATIGMDANAFVGPMFSSRVIAAVGLPDSSLVSQGDDTEFTLRVRHNAGLLLVPGATVIHKDAGQARWDTIPAWKVFYANRNQVWLLRRHFGICPTAVACLFALIGSLRRINRLSVAWARLRGVWAGLSGLPGQ